MGYAKAIYEVTQRATFLQLFKEKLYENRAE